MAPRPLQRQQAPGPSGRADRERGARAGAPLASPLPALSPRGGVGAGARGRAPGPERHRQRHSFLGGAGGPHSTSPGGMWPPGGGGESRRPLVARRRGPALALLTLPVPWGRPGSPRAPVPKLQLPG